MVSGQARSLITTVTRCSLRLLWTEDTDATPTLGKKCNVEKVVTWWRGNLRSSGFNKYFILFYFNINLNSEVETADTQSWLKSHKQINFER